MFSIKASLILLVVSVFFVRSSQAQTNISATEAEAADASAKQRLGGQNIGQAGACIREHNVIYGGNIISQVTVGNMQDCADLCAQMKEGLFWTFQNKTCTLRNSIE